VRNQFLSVFNTNSFSDSIELNFHEILTEPSKAKQYAQIFYQYMKDKIDLKVTPNITKILNNAFLSASSNDKEIHDHMLMLCESVFFMKLINSEILPLVNDETKRHKFDKLQVEEIVGLLVLQNKITHF